MQVMKDCGIHCRRGFHCYCDTCHNWIVVHRFCGVCNGPMRNLEGKWECAFRSRHGRKEK